MRQSQPLTYAGRESVETRNVLDCCNLERLRLKVLRNVFASDMSEQVQ